METELNCSSYCESGVCFIHPAVNSQQGWDVLQRLCTLSTTAVEVQSKSLSPVLCAVVWTLLSCGILLAIFFIVFTLRFRNNRIVKMSSPNLNVLTLCGSLLTYSSGFLFAMEDRAPAQGAEPRAVLQAWIWTLCIGSSLVFGPILGKTWRLYRVFTQRVPDKRVIIRDIQLIGLVGLLILVDIVVLATWGLADPVKCARSITAVVKAVEWDTSYSLSQLELCSSLYSDLWAILLSVLKGSLLLYGTYLAGLTSNVSLPPVNQSSTIAGAVCLVTMSTAVAVPVSRYLSAWPNVVYGVVSGAIFICTLAINCLLFVPQLTQWRQFEEEMNPHPSQMAKYFSSPSKSLRSMYSEDEIFFLLGENDSMKRILSEKNAVIDSLQEQVKSAKDKLLKLMSVSQLHDREMDSSNTNLNSSSTQTTVLLPEPPPTSLQQIDLEKAPPNPPPYVPPPPPPPSPTPPFSTSYKPLASPTATDVAPSSPSLLPPPLSPPLSPRTPDGASQISQANQWRTECMSDRISLRGTTDDVLHKLILSSAKPLSGLYGQVILEDVLLAPPIDRCGPLHGCSPLSAALSSLAQADTSVPAVECVASPGVSGGGLQGFVSSEQLQEILQDLSVDAVGNSLRSPDAVRRPSINPSHDDITPLSPLSPRSPFQLYYPSISPYIMRKRRPPFHSSRNATPTYYPGSAPTPQRRRSAPPGQERTKESDSTKPEPIDTIVTLCQRQDLQNRESEEEEEEVPLQSRRGTRRDRRAPKPRRCSVTCFSERPGSGGRGERSGQPAERTADPQGSSDSESSSSEDYCYYHRHYCEACLQGPYESSDSSTSETDSEFWGLYHSSNPVVFKEDLKPTFV